MSSVVVQAGPVIQVTRQVVTVAAPGPQGPAGTGVRYVHTQATPASQWTCDTGLSQPKEPTVFLSQFPNTPVIVDTEFLSDGIVLIHFAEPNSGYAIF